MPERKGIYRTAKGLDLETKHQNTYVRWWLGKHVQTPYYENSEHKKLITGKVEKVEYIGNSMTGIVELTLECGFVYLVSGPGSAKRPRKKDVEVIFQSKEAQPS